VRTLIRSLGELCITAGLVLLLFVAYELWGTGAYTSGQQDQLSKQLDKQWNTKRTVTTSEKVHLGQGMALIRIPRLGKNYHYVVIEGVTVADLRKGPGHYPGTALPGGIGNFVVSGHRTTYAAPFNRVDELRDGDKILVDTQDKQYIYQVTGEKVVMPTQVDVTEPVPFHAGARPTKHLITLTTCHPKYSAARRLVVFGELMQEIPRVNTVVS
jgi:sortase A